MSSKERAVRLAVRFQHYRLSEKVVDAISREIDSAVAEQKLVTEELLIACNNAMPFIKHGFDADAKKVYRQLVKAADNAEKKV